jgi:hypothetical protein
LVDAYTLLDALQSNNLELKPFNAFGPFSSTTTSSQILSAATNAICFFSLSLSAGFLAAT